MAILGLFHIGIYTKDINTSIDFYSEVLGFEQQWHGMVDHPTGLIEAAVMALDDCIVELVKPTDLGRVNNSAGPIQHLALRVSDLPSVMQSLKEKGVDFSHEGLEELPTFGKGISHAFLYGPSGERIELAEVYS
ncbi:MAG: VOC family protein [Firmicutes bacterium]|nr:VOC family protein [Bacillota bacterium]